MQAELNAALRTGITQGNYATQESSGQFHLMPQWHLPEWREERAGGGGAGICAPWQFKAKKLKKKKKKKRPIANTVIANVK